MNRFFVLISCLKVTQAKLACHIFFTLQKLDFKPKEKIFDYIVCSIFSFLYKAISWHDRKKIYKSTSWIIGDTIDQARLIIRNESQDVYICLPLDNSPETSNQSFFFFLPSFLFSLISSRILFEVFTLIDTKPQTEYIRTHVHEHKYFLLFLALIFEQLVGIRFKKVSCDRFASHKLTSRFYVSKRLSFDIWLQPSVKSVRFIFIHVWKISRD